MHTDKDEIYVQINRIRTYINNLFKMKVIDMKVLNTINDRLQNIEAILEKY